jgi:hypothetical protein
MAKKSICGLALCGLLAAGGAEADSAFPDDSSKPQSSPKESGRDPYKQAGAVAPAPAPSAPPALAKAGGDLERYVGVIPSTKAAYDACPTGNRVSIYMDDEDTQNGDFQSQFHNFWNTDSDGPYGLLDGNGSNTRITFCKVPGVNLRPLSGGEGLDYIVLRLDGACPSGGLPFSYYLDNEDGGNNNSNTGNIYPNSQSTSGTRWEFCYFPAAAGGAQSLPDLSYVGGNYSYFAPFNSMGHVLPAWVKIYNEDSGNNNSVDWKGMSSANQARILKIMTYYIKSTWFAARKLGSQ